MSAPTSTPHAVVIGIGEAVVRCVQVQEQGTLCLQLTDDTGRRVFLSACHLRQLASCMDAEA